MFSWTWLFEAVCKGPMRRLQSVIPTGQSLPAESWCSRHHGILVVLCLHAVGFALFGLMSRQDLTHCLSEAGLLVAIAMLAGLPSLHPRIRAAVASGGLITASALLVHVSGDYIEAHFHYFVMLVIIALYQDWVPFLLALGCDPAPWDRRRAVSA